MRLTLGLLALLVFAFVQPMPAQSFITRDSAGIRIIENSALGDAPVRFRLAPQSVLDVGGLEANPELEFAATRGELRAFPLPDGGLAVLDISRLQLFSKAGERQRGARSVTKCLDRPSQCSGWCVRDLDQRLTCLQHGRDTWPDMCKQFA
jgi:hypothetical protein